ncbi:hypothetical protein EJB05_07797 [Eragrostis curvula]|uniref:Uncharacterized protein n=1 Tax=Eragrostis curvula TaxID=38414 RepID=A0A5J9WLE5_9POAL|nr:hypothetical protein EJB05_07797 [Eragrostis curvula]
MEEENIEQADSSQIVSLSSPKSLQSSIEPELIEDINEDHNNDLQKTPSASSDASMQYEHSTSLILTDNKRNLLEIYVDQSVPIDDSVTLSPKVDSSGLPSTNEVPDDFPSSSNEAYESKEAQDASISMQSSEVIPSASCEPSMQQGRSVSPILTANESNSREIAVEQKVTVGDSITPSPKVENNELPSTNDPDGFPSCTNEAYESKEIQDSIAPESSEVNVRVVSQSLLRSREGVQVDASCTDYDKVASETPRGILKMVKEDKDLLVHRLPKRQMSLADTRQKLPAPVSRSVSGKNLRTDKATVDTTTHIESVKVAASKFGGSINWKTRRTQPAQGNGHSVHDLDKLKNEISECKRQAEAAETAKMSVFNDLERTNKLIDELKHVLERKQAEEVDAKEDLEFFQFIVQEMEDRVVSGDSGLIKEKQKIIQVLAKLKLVKDESRKLQEDYDSLLIEQDVSIKKAQAAFTLSKETEREVEDLTLELKHLKEMLDLDRATCHDAKERKKEALTMRDMDCSTWKNNLRQAGQELNQLGNKLSSIEELKSELDTASILLLNLKNELAMCTEANPAEEAQEQGGGNHKSMQEVIPSRNELEEHRKSIAKVTDELCALKVTAATLKSELNKERVALAAMQQKETRALITIQSLKLEIKLTLQELEAVHAKAESRERMVGLPEALQDAALEAADAQEELRKTWEEIEQTKAALSAMEFKLQAVLREVEAAKESERLSLSAIRALEGTNSVISIEQDSPHQMITVDLDEYTSLLEKAHRAGALVHERTAAAIAQVEAAKASESQTLSRLDETLKALEERKQALLAATEQADRATEGKLAMEQEMRKWREEGRQRRRASEASKSDTRASKSAEIIVERSGDAKCTSKEDGCALVHPLSDASGRSSPNELVLDSKPKKARKLSFFPRVIMFLGRRRLKAAR